MMRITKFLALLGSVILLSSSLLFPQFAAGQTPAGPRLRLHRGTFDAQGAAPALASALAAPAPGPFAIIQFSGPITLRDRQALERSGVTILEYLPDYAYLVRGSPGQLDAAARLPGVYARTAFVLADKLAPSLLRAIARGETALGKVHIFGWADNGDPTARGQMTQALQAIGVGQKIEADLNLIVQIAALEPVRWIEPAGQPRLLNDYARTIMNVDPVWQNRQLFGAGQIIAVADSGLDTGDPDTLSPDFAGRIVATHVLSAGGHWDDNHGHGTHVAGSAAGAGVQSGANPAQHVYTNSFAGVAPEAGLIIQAFEASPADGSITGLDPDYYQLFARAYTDGARLHTDSWGDLTGPITDTAAAYGGYPFGSMRTDAFIWDHPDMAIFFAAGNSGKDGEPGDFGFCAGDGVIDPDSLLMPGTAKNVITVGASESNRVSGGVGGLPWVLFDFLCLNTAPIASDPVSDNANGMAAFSSRGPTDDGRIKPDLVTPGTNIVSNRSHHPSATALYGQHETNADYAYSAGTSMATPLAAGAGVLVRQWITGQGLANPSAAAVKAVLLNTTHDMAPGQYGTGATQEIPFTRPNSVAGWGRVNLGFIDAPAPFDLWLDDHTGGLTTGQVVSYTHSFIQPLTVLTDTQPLRVMLAWTDPPASLSAGAQLVNDLDLVVVGPGGVPYYGNDVASGDRTNNVEGIIINNPPPGQYEIGVYGFNVPVASQPYALTVAGPIRDANEPGLTVTKTASSATADAGQTITYTYQVVNSGGITLTGVTGADDKLGAVLFTPNTITPGQTTTATLTYIVQVDDMPGPLTNTVTITGSVEGSAQTVNDSDTVVVALYHVDLAVAKSVNNVLPTEGDLITYTISVMNVGGTVDPATGIVISDTLPAGLSLVSSSSSQGLYNANTWDVGDLSAADPAFLTITTQIDPGTAGQTITNTAALQAANEFEIEDGNNRDSASVTVSFTDLALQKTVNNTMPGEGEIITYTLVVSNDGLYAASNIVVSDTLPSPVTYITAGSTQGNYDETTGAWQVGNLNAGASATLDIQGVIALGTAGQTITNTAIISRASPIDTEPANDADAVALVVQETDLTISKQVDHGTPVEGETIVYTIVITSQGAGASGVVISDAIPNGVTYQSATASHGVYSETGGLWTISSLPVDSPATLTISATVNAATSGQTITNTAIIAALDQTDSIAANNQAEATITVAMLDLALAKSVSDLMPVGGSMITYTIQVTNIGPGAATGLVISDALPAGVSYGTAWASQGVYSPTTSLWPVGSLTAGNTAMLTITATIDTGQAAQTITNTARIVNVDQTDATPGNNVTHAAINVIAPPSPLNMTYLPVILKVVP